MEVGKTATLTVADTPKVTETLIDLFKIDMETGKSTPQGTASLEGAEFTWSYYDGHYNADNLPAKATRTWTTKTVPIFLDIIKEITHRTVFFIYRTR